MSTGANATTLCLLVMLPVGCAEPAFRTNEVAGLASSYVIEPPSGCVMRAEGEDRICTFGSGGSRVGVVLARSSDRWAPQQVTAASDWESWILVHQALAPGMEAVEASDVDESAIATQIGAERCVSLYAHLRVAGFPDSDDATMTCVFTDPASGSVDTVVVGYAEFRHDPDRGNRGFAERAAPVLHSLRRASGP